MPEVFQFRKKGPVLEVTLCRGKANTITAENSRQLNKLWEDFRENPEQCFAIFSGQGKIFSVLVGTSRMLQKLEKNPIQIMVQGDLEG